MIRPQFTLDLNRELFVDNFAGGGGASTGIEMALGRHVDHAINHDARALGMHRINHPQTIHHCEDVFDVNPAEITEGRPIGGAWFSPDCKHFSKAKGGKPLSKKIRGLAFVILRYAAYRARVIYMENVEEIKTWGPLLPNNKPDPCHRGRTWEAFKLALGPGVPADHPDLNEMVEVLKDERGTNTITREQLIRGFGYHVEHREIRACDDGSPTIRRRLFLIARCDGMPIIWPDHKHAAPERARKLGLKPWRPVASCIDWSVRCHSIFLTKAQARKYRVRRPLRPATLRRVAKGIERHVLNSAEPFIVSLTHQGGDRIEPISSPAKTLTGANRGEKALVDCNVAPFITEHANASNQRTMPADEPLRTQCAEVKGGHFALVSGMLVGAGGPARSGEPRSVTKPGTTLLTKNNTSLTAASLVKMRYDGESEAVSPSLKEPHQTIRACGQHHAVAAAFMVQNNGGFNRTPHHPLTKSCSTVTSAGSQQGLVAADLVKFYGTDQDPKLADPSHTVTTKDRFALTESMAYECPLTPDQIAGAKRVAQFLRDHGVQFEGEFATVRGYVIVDIGLRMLLPRELFRAQGFSDDYIIDRAWLVNPKTGELKEVALTKGQQIRMCGNSVCPQVAAALVRANSADMATWFKQERRLCHA